MSSANNVLFCGHEVEAVGEGYNKNPYVCVHKMGESARSWFTPDEAREFAALIVRMADRAEGES